jgi:Papain family cysteine protease/Cathepsin propeptide inhibitor domain (I29)
MHTLLIDIKSTRIKFLTIVLYANFFGLEICYKSKCSLNENQFSLRQAETMKALTLILFIAGAASLGSCSRSNCDVTSQDRQFFNDWKREYNKYYSSAEEERKAMMNVLVERDEVEEHNELYEQGRKTYEIGLNEHSDLTHEEFERYLLGLNEEDESSAESYTRFSRASYSFPPGPRSVNWTAKGLVGPVENQKHCGACWAFSTAAIVNAAQLKVNKNAELVSAQQLIDCDHHVSCFVVKSYTKILQNRSNRELTAVMVVLQLPAYIM